MIGLVFLALLWLATTGHGATASHTAGTVAVLSLASPITWGVLFSLVLLFTTGPNEKR